MADERVQQASTILGTSAAWFEFESAANVPYQASLFEISLALTGPERQEHRPSVQPMGLR